MDPMQEILETVREIRKGQLEQLAWRKRYLLKVRIFSILIGIPVFAYLIWAFLALRH